MFKTRLGGDYWAILKLFVYLVLPLGFSLAAISHWLNLTPKFWFMLIVYIFAITLFLPLGFALYSDGLLW